MTFTRILKPALIWIGGQRSTRPWFLRLFHLVNWVTVAYLRWTGIAESICLRGSFPSRRFVPFASDIDLAIVASEGLLTGGDEVAAHLKLARVIARARRINPLLRDEWQTIVGRRDLAQLERYWYMPRLDEWRIAYGAGHACEFAPGDRRLCLIGQLSRQYLWTAHAARSYWQPNSTQIHLNSAARKAYFFAYLIAELAQRSEEQFSFFEYATAKAKAYAAAARHARTASEDRHSLFFQMMQSLSVSAELLEDRYPEPIVALKGTLFVPADEDQQTRCATIRNREIQSAFVSDDVLCLLVDQLSLESLVYLNELQDRPKQPMVLMTSATGAGWFPFVARYGLFGNAVNPIPKFAWEFNVFESLFLPCDVRLVLSRKQPDAEIDRVFWRLLQAWSVLELRHLPASRLDMVAIFQHSNLGFQEFGKMFRPWLEAGGESISLQRRLQTLHRISSSLTASLAKLDLRGLPSEGSQIPGV